jgi:hypothetical protein
MEPLYETSWSRNISNVGLMAKKSFAVTFGLVVGLVVPTIANATRQRVRDGNDVPGRLDIQQVKVSHKGDSIRHTITTFGRWRTSVIGANTPHFLAFGLDLSGTARFERFVFLVGRNGRPRAFYTTARGSVLDRFPASRPNKRSISVLVPRRVLDDAGGYRWAAFSVFGTSRGDVVDASPNRRARLHDIVAPKIKLISFPNPSTNVSVETTFNVSFAVSDPGSRSSGLRRWTLEYRRNSGAWVRLPWRTGAGTKTVTMGGEEGVNWRLRVVAQDREGNTSRSPTRLTSVPFDEANGIFGSAYGGTWSGGVLGAPYLGNVAQTSESGATFTHTFTGSYIAWIGPGAPSIGAGTATVTIDGGPPVLVDQAAKSGDRAIIFQASGLDPTDSHTIVITQQSGTIAIDGIVIR